MSGFPKYLLAAAAVVALPAPAAAADVCAALNRIIAASRETPPFASVRRAAAAGEEIVPGFGPGRCQVTPAREVLCGYHGMGADYFGDWPDLSACLGVEALPQPSRPRFRDWTRTYVASGLRFDYGVECIGCAGPSSSHFSVTFEGRARPEE